MKLILVGGFLGAGKTTLLWESAKRLTERGRVVGLITNDQAPDLVDTALLSRSGASVREVAGSCFCCNFEGFREAVQSLVDGGADCILAEPVGSCTDLSATIIQPLKALFPAYHVAPLTVLLDPSRVREVLQEKQPLLHADAVYILHMQLEEADQIVLNKVDTLSQTEREEIMSFLREDFPQANIGAISALTGEGVDEWLDDILRDRPTGTKIAVVDYDRYANGEAILGWLNAVIGLQWTEGTEPDWEDFVRRLLEVLHDRLLEMRSEVGHIKMLLDCSQGRITANLTGLNDLTCLRKEGSVEGLTALLTVNARVQMSPDGIERIFRGALNDVSNSRATHTIRAFHCIKPGRPQPTYRYDAVVE